MQRNSILLAFSFAIIILIACVCQSVYGSEISPTGLERVHTRCVWDNDMNMIADEGANAGQSIKIY